MQKNIKSINALYLLTIIVGLLPICLGIPLDAVRIYQCTSDYIEVTDPTPIDSELCMIRVCIESLSNQTSCQKIIETTFIKTAKTIEEKEEKVVVGGKTRDALKDRVELEMRLAEGGKCMIAAHLTDDYFINSDSTEPLYVVVSGSVLMTTTTAKSDSTTDAHTTSSHLRKEPAPTTTTTTTKSAQSQGTEVEFNIAISLTLGDGLDDEHHQIEIESIVDGGVKAYGIATGVLALIAMMS